MDENERKSHSSQFSCLPNNNKSLTVPEYQIWDLPGGTRGEEPAYPGRRLRVRDSIPGWQDPLEESVATHSSILAWRIHGL